MKAILLGIVVFILLVGGVLLFNDYFTRRKHQKLITHKYNVVKPLMRQLAAKEAIAQEVILMLAKDPSMRHALFRVLEIHNKENLFPSEYFTIEKGAESFMVNWLEFPTELGLAPREIELVTIITLRESEALDYYVFKYRSNTPHWAAKSNWMLGITGPYQEKSMPFDIPLRVFSRFKTIDSTSPQKEVMWVHNNINPKSIHVT